MDIDLRARQQIAPRAEAVTVATGRTLRLIRLGHIPVLGTAAAVRALVGAPAQVEVGRVGRLQDRRLYTQLPRCVHLRQSAVA